MFIHVIENESEDPELGAELFNVSFDLDGGSGYVHEQNVVRGGKPAAVRHPTMEGYYFCRGVPPYGETFLIARDTVDDDLVLKAVWKKSPEAGDRGPGDGVIF